jgi:hypothetical protein
MFWIALAFLVIGGAADMASAAFRSTILQQAASDELRGCWWWRAGRGRRGDRRAGGAGLCSLPGG